MPILEMRSITKEFPGVKALSDVSITVAAGGRVSSVWADAAAYPYAQVFTGDSLPGGRSRRTGVAVEPMTCPANAFATGAALVLEPGATWSASCRRITARPPPSTRAPPSRRPATWTPWARR